MRYFTVLDLQIFAVLIDEERGMKSLKHVYHLWNTSSSNTWKCLIEFLASIDQDVVVFVDEYEKVFVTDESFNV